MKKIRLASLMALLSIVLFSSCHKQKYCWIRLSNGYYKELTTVSISGVTFDNVKVGHTSEYVQIPIGSFMVTVQTADGKFLSSEVPIPYKKERFTVIVNSAPEIYVRTD